MTEFNKQASTVLAEAENSAKAFQQSAQVMVTKQANTIANHQTKNKAQAAINRREAENRESVRRTNTEICNFWQADYQKTRSREAEVYRKQACSLIGIRY